MCEWHPWYSSNADWSLSFISVNGCYLQRKIYYLKPNVFYLHLWKIIMMESNEVKHNSKYVTHVCFQSQTDWALPHQMTTVSEDDRNEKKKKKKEEEKATC